MIKTQGGLTATLSAIVGMSVGSVVDGVDDIILIWNSCGNNRTELPGLNIIPMDVCLGSKRAQVL